MEKLDVKAVLLENCKVVIKDIEVPKLQEGDVLVKMKACGLCGTDLEKISCQYVASQQSQVPLVTATY